MAEADHINSVSSEDLFQEAAATVLDYADSVLKKDLNGSGQKLYTMWGKTTRKECFMFNYQNENFRAAYARNRFLVSGRCFIGAIDRISRECPESEQFLDTLERVVSVGCGPGPDAAALSSYLRGRNCQQRLVHYCVDQCPEWAVYVQLLDAFVSRKRLQSLWFKNLRIGDRESVGLLPDADMIVFSFSNTALMDPRIWPEVLRRYRFIFILDSIRESLKDEYADQGFRKFELPNDRTCCYYFFREKNGPLPQLAIGPISPTGGGPPELSLRPGGCRAAFSIPPRAHPVVHTEAKTEDDSNNVDMDTDVPVSPPCSLPAQN